jgi:hypothetical protein
VFISGGSKNEMESLNTCFELEEKEYSFIKKGNMNYGRESHSMVQINAKFLLSVGSRV